MKIRLQDIEVGDLNNVCIMVLSKFARVLHEHDGTVLKLQNPKILLEVAKYARSVDHPELRLLYQRLRLELRNQLNQAVPQHAEVGSLVSHPDLRTRVQNRIRFQTKRLL